MILFSLYYYFYVFQVSTHVTIQQILQHFDPLVYLVFSIIYLLFKTIAFHYKHLITYLITTPILTLTLPNKRERPMSTEPTTPIADTTSPSSSPPQSESTTTTTTETPADSTPSSSQIDTEVVSEQPIVISATPATPSQSPPSVAAQMPIEGSPSTQYHGQRPFKNRKHPKHFNQTIPKPTLLEPSARISHSGYLVPFTTVTDVDKCSVYLRNVPFNATKDDLIQHFEGCGEIVRVTIPLEGPGSLPKGRAYIEFTDPECVEKALCLNDTVILNRHIVVLHKYTTPHDNIHPQPFQLQPQQIPEVQEQLAMLRKQEEEIEKQHQELIDEAIKEGKPVPILEAPRLPSVVITVPVPQHPVRQQRQKPGRTLRPPHNTHNPNTDGETTKTTEFVATIASIDPTDDKTAVNATDVSSTDMDTPKTTVVSAIPADSTSTNHTQNVPTKRTKATKCMLKFFAPKIELLFNYHDV